MKLKKLNHIPYQDVVVSAGRNALKLQSFQTGTFGAEVTTRPGWTAQRVGEERFGVGMISPSTRIAID
jgi:hypothetical protein